MAMTCCTSPGRGPKASRLSACTARFCSPAAGDAVVSFFLARICGTICGTTQAKLTHSTIGVSLLRLDLIRTPGKDRSLDYQPGTVERVAVFRGSPWAGKWFGDRSLRVGPDVWSRRR